LSFELDGYFKTYAWKTSIVGKITVERLQDKEEVIKVKARVQLGSGCKYRFGKEDC
jgi:hypothetical protein